MTKKTELAENESANNEIVQVEKTQLDNVVDTLAKLDKMQDNVPLTCESKEFKTIGERGNFIFLGLSSMTFKQVDKDTGEETSRTIDAVKFCDSKKNVFINAGVNLVEQLRHLEQGTPISIEFTGSVKKVKKYKICLLS